MSQTFYSTHNLVEPRWINLLDSQIVCPVMNFLFGEPVRNENTPATIKSSRKGE
jgi:hypothetical protein